MVFEVQNRVEWQENKGAEGRVRPRVNLSLVTAVKTHHLH